MYRYSGRLPFRPNFTIAASMKMEIILGRNLSGFSGPNPGLKKYDLVKKRSLFTESFYLIRDQHMRLTKRKINIQVVQHDDILNSFIWIIIVLAVFFLAAVKY